MLCGNVIPPYKDTEIVLYKLIMFMYGCYIVAKHYYNRLIRHLKQLITIMKNNHMFLKVMSIDNKGNILQENDQWFYFTPRLLKK